MRLRLAPVLAAFFMAACAARAAVTCGAPGADGTSVCAIDPAIDPLALCNDGSVPAFSFRPGSGNGAARWLIWLEGGGQCADIPSCIQRGKVARGLLTSAGFSPKPGSGILSTSAALNPLLYDVNTVVVHYCSSDDWAGGHHSTAAFSAGDPSTWHFQGRRIALAAVASIAQVAPGFANASDIVLGGSSAGGVGVTVTANDILPHLPRAPDIRVVNDAGFALDIGQYDPSLASPYVFGGRHNAFAALFTSGMALWSGRGDAVCAAAAHTAQERVGCFSAKVFQQGYIGVPSFIAESQLDTAQLSDEICPQNYGRCRISHNAKSSEGAYSAAFGTSMALALIGAGTPASYAVYSPDSYMHTILTSAQQYGTRYAFPGGRLSAQAVFTQWLRATGGRVVQVGTGPGVGAIKGP